MLRRMAGGAVVALSSLGAATAAAQQVSVTIDPAGERARISSYLYGQFIEHLGRCIRDGIWAEMLRDRKFLLEPGKTWEALKPQGADAQITHDTAGAYAGDHCMLVWARGSLAAPCGIRQAGIGLMQGREYVGYAWLASPGAPAPVTLRVQWGPGPDDAFQTTVEGLTGAYARRAFRFTAGASTDNAALSVTIDRPGGVWIGCLSLMPADNVQGMRADTLALIRRLNPPIMRWPGGNFVSGYQWKDGIGPRDRRPPRWERAWNDVEDNDFGIDEFMRFCRLVKTEPYIAVNAGLGSAQDAADEVDYANGAASTPWGARRAANGSRAPYGVRWWGVGNEMYGDWQLGNVPVERYALRHVGFVQAMRARDPGIGIIAVGAPGPWNDVVLGLARDQMEMLSGHHYSGRGAVVPLTAETARAYAERFPAYSGSVAEGIRRLVDDFRPRVRRGDPLHTVKLAVDEWGIVRDWNPQPDGPGIGSFEHYYTMGDAVAAARGANALLRAADVVGMANWAQTVNVLGTIKTSRTAAALDPTGHVLALYREHLLGTHVPLTVAGADAGLVDAVAALRDDGSWALALVNSSVDREVAVRLEGLPGRRWTGAWRIAGPGPGATNVPGQPESVTTEAVKGAVGPGGAVTLPPHSVTVLRRR